MLKKRGKWLTKVLFGHSRCYLDAVTLQSVVFFPLARALVTCFPLEQILKWGQRTWSPFPQHLALWMEIWPLLNSSQRNAQLLKWFASEWLQNLICSELIAMNVREKKHLVLVYDLLRALPENQQADYSLAILSFALHYANFPLLSEFFSWTPSGSIDEVWEEFLTDYIFWSNSTEFSAQCTLLQNAPLSYGSSLAQQIIAKILMLGHKLTEPRSDELELLFTFCHTEERKRKFVQNCLECCLEKPWSWELLGCLWHHITDQEKYALTKIAQACKSEPRVIKHGYVWQRDYTDFILEIPPLATSEIKITSEFLWELLFHGQPVLFLVLWERLLAAHERESMRNQFALMRPNQWLTYIGLETGKPRCLQTVLYNFLLGKQDLEERFWDILFEHDFLSDYVTATGAIPVEELSSALPSGPKETFIYDCLGRYCSMYQIYANNPSIHRKYSRATLACCILETENTLNQLPLASTPPNTQALVQALLCTNMPCLEELTNKAKLDSFLAENTGEVLMTAVLHQKTQNLIHKVDSSFEHKLIAAHDWWNSLVRINMPNKVCAHSLGFQTSLSDNGRRPDFKWLETLFENVADGKNEMILPVDVPGLLEFSNLNARLDVLSEEFDTLLDLMIPNGDTGMMGTPYETMAKGVTGQNYIFLDNENKSTNDESKEELFTSVVTKPIKPAMNGYVVG